MNIACNNCPAKYAVPDEKVRGRKVKITCKRCGATIIIDGTSPQGAGPRSESATPSVPPASVAAATILWTVAVTEEDHQEMTAEQVVAAYKAGKIDAETFVWREGMPDWLTPFEIPEIETALRAKGIERAKPEPPAPAPAPAPQAPAAVKSSGWREPGRWDSGKPASDLTFDDVTVAMAAPKAQALLDAISTTENAPPAEPATANPFAEDEATIVADSSRFALATEEEPARAAPRPAAGAPAEVQKEPVAETAAEPPPDTARSQVTPLPREKMPSAPGRPRPKLPSAPGVPARTPVKTDEAPASMTGARSESSVLFSLDQLVGKDKSKPSADKEERVDARALIGATKSGPDSAPPSLANLAAGPMFTAPVMAAPDFNAPPPASSKPVHSAPVASVAPLSPTPSTSSGSGRWLLLGLLVLAGGAGAFFLMRPAATPPPVQAPQVVAPVAKPETPSAPASPASGEAPPAAMAAASGAPTEAQPEAVPSAGSPQKVAAAAAPKKSGAVTAAATPAAAPAPQAATDGPPFDAEAAKAALAAAAAAAQGQCASEEGPHGSGKVTVTFVNSGRATNALVAGDFAGSALGGCVARVFRSAKVPAFSGDTVHVSKGVQIP